jgi:hypothetical protein
MAERGGGVNLSECPTVCAPALHGNCPRTAPVDVLEWTVTLQKRRTEKKPRQGRGLVEDKVGVPEFLPESELDATVAWYVPIISRVSNRASPRNPIVSGSVCRESWGRSQVEDDTLSKSGIRNRNLAISVIDCDAGHNRSSGWRGPTATSSRCSNLAVFRDNHLRVGCEIQTLCYTGTNRVITVRRNRNCRQNPNNRHHDHQFDQSKALLGPVVLFHLQLSLVGVSV